MLAFFGRQTGDDGVGTLGQCWIARGPAAGWRKVVAGG